MHGIKKSPIVVMWQERIVRIIRIKESVYKAQTEKPCRRAAR